MGWTKMLFVFSTFLDPCIYGDPGHSENRPEIVHFGFHQKRVKNTPAGRGPATVFAEFS